MGILGLTSALQQCGLLPTFSDETGETFSHKPRQTIGPGSTFAMDGNGLQFHLYELAYFQHYKCTMSMMRKQKEKNKKDKAKDKAKAKAQDGRNRDENQFQDDFHVIMQLLPSMMPLSLIRQETEALLHHLLQIHGIHLNIFFDGEKQPKKLLTKQERAATRTMEESALRNLFQKRILPQSFRSKKKKNKGQPGNSNGNNFIIPDAHAFLHEFPVPPLAFQEIFHIFQVTLRQIQNGSYPTRAKLEITSCVGEADQSVAMASAMDPNCRTYAVGHDSDYLVFGYPADHPLWVMGDLHVQYLPLNSLEVTQEDVSGYVITRKDVAEEFHVSEENIVEAAILSGCDYTKFVMDRKMKKKINFFKDCWEGEGRHTFSGVVEVLADKGEYRAESSDGDQQECIEFSRSLFHLQNVDAYLEDESIVGEDEKDENESEFEDCFEEEEDIERGAEAASMKERIRCLNETLLDYTDAYNEPICIKKQIMEPLHVVFADDQDMEILLMQTLEVMRSNESSSMYDKIPPRISWDDYVLGLIFQRSISAAFDRRAAYEEYDGKYLPSKLFDHLFFYHALAARNLMLAGMENNESSLPPPPSPIKDIKARKTLPIDAHKDEILKSIRNNRVTIIQGETGSGKSSRVPVMLLESEPPDPSFQDVKMFICQPRRIAAKSLTERVRATEPHLKDFIGLRMGHGVREYENRQTKAWFVTTGYLVRYLSNNVEKFNNVTHLVIDEVHERSIDGDIICLLAKRLLKSNPTIRLVLMSATVAADIYQDYFETEVPPIFVGVRCHPITEYYAEDIAKHLNLTSREKTSLREISKKCLNSKCLVPPNSHHLQMLHHLAVQVAVAVGKVGSSVLIFVPGMADILAISEIFEEKMTSATHQYLLIAIHSDIPFEDQMSAFDATRPNEIKIIVATNAAESSLTLPDVDHVVCLGLCKAITYNQKSHRQVLETCWISKANSKQRAGRTGRVRPGSVYRLYPKRAHEEHFAPFEVGEIIRSPLDSVILNLRTIVGNESVSALLDECIEAPDQQNIENSFTSLHRHNFITIPRDDFEITSMGNLVVALGIDLYIAALVGHGIVLGLLPETIELAAILSSPKSPWAIPNALMQEPELYNDIMSKSYASKAAFDGDLLSEPMAIMNLLHDYRRHKSKQRFCAKHALSYSRTSRLDATIDGLRQRVASFLKTYPDSLKVLKPPRSMDQSKVLALRILKVWMFYDGILLLPPLKKDIRNAFVVQLKGDSINKKHLCQILNPDRYKYELKSDCCTIYNGRFAPVVDMKPLQEFREFEEMLLSFSIEKEFSIVVAVVGKCANIYISKDAEMEEWNHLIEECFEFTAKIECSKERNREGDCKMWSLTYVEDCVKAKNKMFYKYTSLAKKDAKVVMRKVNDHLRSTNITSEQNAIMLQMMAIIGGPVNIRCYSSGSQADITISTLVQLFRTPDVFVHRSPQSSHRQSVVFHEKQSGKDDSTKLIKHNSPEALRILQAVAAGRRRGRNIFFINDIENDKDEYEGSEYLEVGLGTKFEMYRWKWMETNESAILDCDSIPATIMGQEEEVYACSGNILELSGGKVRAEGITILPLGADLLCLAKECLGIPSSLTVCDRLKEHIFTAREFHKFWKDTIATSEIQYNPDALDLLCRVFNALGDLEMIPWTAEEANTAVKDSTLILKDEGHDNSEQKESCKKEETVSNTTEENSVCERIEALAGREQRRRKERVVQGPKQHPKSKSNSKTKAVAQAKEGPKYQCPICNVRLFRWSKAIAHGVLCHNLPKHDIRRSQESWMIQSDVPSEPNQGLFDALVQEAIDRIPNINSSGKTNAMEKSTGVADVPSVSNQSLFDTLVQEAIERIPNIKSSGNTKATEKSAEVSAVPPQSNVGFFDALVQEAIERIPNTNASGPTDKTQTAREKSADVSVVPHQSNLGLFDSLVQEAIERIPNINSSGNKKNKPKARYQCPICNESGFSWKSAKKHGAKEHDLSISDMKQNEWLMSGRSSNEVTPSALSESSSKRKQGDVKRKSKPRYRCPICNTDGFSWKSAKKHGVTAHNLSASQMKQKEWAMCTKSDI